MPMPPRAPRPLTKSLFVAGIQCHKLLWWRAHEPNAPELAPTPDQQARFEAGRRVGELARQYVPGGELIGFRHWEMEQKVEDTRRRLAAGAGALYEAAFAAGGAYAAVDILERDGDGVRLVEVKSSTSAKPEHLPDVALQVHVARAAGLDVRGAEVMHLNRECRHPDLSNLFTRTDVVQDLAHWLPQMPDLVAAQRAVVEGPLPDVPIGDHCFDPHECPFFKRCWPAQPADHISTLYLMRRRALELEAEGLHSIHDLPGDLRLNAVQARQMRAVQSGSLVVEPGLVEALREFDGPIAFIDFETVAPAIPIWPGCRPWENVPVQFSVHLLDRTGTWRHVEWLAEGAEDPRPALAERLVEACRYAGALVAYHASFERDCLRVLALGAPHLAVELGEMELRLLDLLPAVRNHVYHPGFGGRFSLKSVLPALVPELTYDDLEIRDGARATVELWRLIFERDVLTARHVARLRRALLRYCERDTWAMVKLLERLRELATTLVVAPTAAAASGEEAVEETGPVLVRRAARGAARPARRAVQLDLGL
jgi:predicted RecB family nuclease